MPNPIPDELIDVMTRVSDALSTALKEDTGRKMGFALLVFDFGPEGNMSFISNAKRGDMVRALRELADNLEREVN